MKILIVDDNPIDLLINTKIIQSVSSDCILTSCDSKESVISFLDNVSSNLDLQPNFIFLDIRMPILDGFELLQELEKTYTPILEKAKIYMLSSSLDTADLQKVEDHPLLNGFIDKPLRQEALLEIIGENSN